MIIRKEEINYTTGDIAEVIKTATTLEEIVFIQHHVEKSSMNTKNKNALLTMIPFKMASLMGDKKLLNRKQLVKYLVDNKCCSTLECANMLIDNGVENIMWKNIKYIGFGNFEVIL